MVDPTQQHMPIHAAQSGLPPPATLQQFYAVDEKVFRAAMPTLASDFEFLAAVGITSIISLEELTDEAKSLAQTAGIKVSDVPLVDFMTPSREQVRTFLHVLDKDLACGRKVLIHCSEGRHRTALMAGFYLIARKGLHPLAAYWEVDKRYLGDLRHFKQFLLEFGAELLSEQA